MRVWKNERGLTLTELMAAVVIMGIVAVPLTSLGTSFLHSYQADQQVHQAVLLAERKMVLAKSEVESTGELSDEKRKGTDNELGMSWTIDKQPFRRDGQEISGLHELTITVHYKDPLDPEQQGEYTLTALARPRVQP